MTGGRHARHGDGPTEVPRGRGVLHLPNGFHPAGIGPAPYAYVGSLLGGAVYRASLLTGQGKVIHAGLGGVKLPTTNGILVHGRTLYAPRMNDLAVLRLDPTGHNARPARTVTDARLPLPAAPAAGPPVQRGGALAAAPGRGDGK